MDKKEKNIKLNLFLTFLKIGTFTFGGGYAMIAVLEQEFVSEKKWITKEEFLDIVAIAESTPGPIAINSATFIGYKMAGFWGSFFATLGVCLPSIVIIFIISLFYDAFLKIEYVAYAFKGIQACVVYLIASAGIKMYKGLDKSPLTTIILVAVIVVFLGLTLMAVDFSSVLFILVCGIIGLIPYGISRIKKGGKKQ